MKHEFGNLKVWIRFHPAEVAERILHVEIVLAKSACWPVRERDAEKSRAGRGKRDGVFFSAVVGDVDEFAEGLAIVARFQDEPKGWLSWLRRGSAKKVRPPQGD